MAVIESKWMDKGMWYNTTMCIKLNGQILEYLKTGRKYRYELLCAVGAY